MTAKTEELKTIFHEERRRFHNRGDFVMTHPTRAMRPEYRFRIPTCANISFGDIDSWLDDWHSLTMLIDMQETYE